ncbi:probable cytochrome P450 6a14 [Venturia canescens]|uniref:probable cytochrome P450 6a14 n=1 Tax=Venturia canescens TaxID=32260 RepID=UPI001C9C1B35|nr:probable cytochrome P450 6a14 [Venturia canescens]
MDLTIFEFGLIIIGLLSALYYYLVSTYDYWESRGARGPKPIIFFGTIKDLMLNKCSMGDYVTNVYNEWKNEPYVGVFLRRQPVLILNDLDLIKDVLIKDFNTFAERTLEIHEKIEPLSAHLFNLEAKRWRPLRHQLTPVFTSGKLKQMFYLLIECADHLEKYLDDLVDSTKTNEMIIEFRDFTAKFTTDVIGVCAFGLQMNAIADENSTFRSMGKRIFANNWKTLMLFRLRTIAPQLFEIFGRFLVDKEMSDFYINTMTQTMDYRKKNGIVKHDFIDLLMVLRDHPEKVTDIELNDGLLAAQLFVFFVAGFETSSSAISHALYELALNPEVQEKLRQEIKHKMNETGNKIDYDMIKSMKYLDMVFQETLRKYPPVTFLMRKSIEPYTFHDSSNNKLLTIKKGESIWIPNYAIQHDHRYFPEPEVFDPERFTEEAIKSRHSMIYLPFGDGPRNCIGKRFGVMQTKVGLIKILHHYSVETCEKTTIPYESDPKAFLLSPKNGIHLKIVRDALSTDL